MKVEISSDMTQEGTVITVDGKKLKNVKEVDFDVYEKLEWDEGPNGCMVAGDKVPCVKLRVSTEEEDEDGTCKEVHYHYCKEGEEDGILDRREMKVSEANIADAIADKMLGRQSRL
jgi:hypothetical protein